MHRSLTTFSDNLRGLIVDDHDIIRKSIAKVLRNLGFSEIIECSNVREALNIIESDTVDLIVSELDFNHLSGFDLLDKIRSSDTGFDTPFIVVTGNADKENIVKAASKGTQDYIVKPFTAEDMETKIERVLLDHHAPGPVLSRIKKTEKFILAGNYTDAEFL